VKLIRFLLKRFDPNGTLSLECNQRSHTGESRYPEFTMFYTSGFRVCTLFRPE